MAGNVAKLLNVRYAGAISVTGGVSESQITGWLIPIGEGRYLPAPFIDAFEDGGLFLADEIDAADPNVALAMNQALSDQKIFIAARAASGLDPCVHQHKDFVFIAGANTYLRGGGSQFNGRNAQDAALRDRLIFVAIKTDYAYEAALCGIPAPADAEQVWTPVAVLTDAERKLWGPWKWAVEKHLESQTSAKDAAQYTFGTRSLQRALACRSVGVSTALTCELLFSGWNPTTIAGLGDLANGPVGTVA
jgi:MoxR-like ATPase